MTLTFTKALTPTALLPLHPSTFLIEIFLDYINDKEKIGASMLNVLCNMLTLAKLSAEALKPLSEIALNYSMEGNLPASRIWSSASC